MTTPTPTSTSIPKPKSSEQLKLVNKPIGPIGYGLMGLTWRDPAPSQEQAFEAMKTALERGANFWNGGELYGSPSRHSGHLLAEYFEKYPEDVDKVVLSIKGGLGKNDLIPNGTEANVRRSVEDVLATLEGTGKKIDIFECARVDPNVPIEETLKALAALKEEGKIGGIGLSEVSAATIERAAKVVPIDAVEVELSLWTPNILHNGVAATCARLNIPIVAYSPLSRGALATVLKGTSDLPPGDMRRIFPRFQDDVLAQNNRLVEELAQLAKKKSQDQGEEVTMAQIALAWVSQLSGRTITTKGEKGETKVKLGTIIPIPGATTRQRVEENTVLVELSAAELDEIDGIIARNPIRGQRYPAAGMTHLDA